jgi:hypothetical protein
VAGIAFIVAFVVTVAVHPFNVAVTTYAPLCAVVVPVRDGFCNVDVNDDGPVHEYVDPASAVDVKFNG